MEETLKRLNILCHRRGFIFALLMIIRRDQTVNVSEYGKINTYDRLITEEIGLLLRYWVVSNPNMLSFPDSLEEISLMKHEAITLLDNLHRSYIRPEDVKGFFPQTISSPSDYGAFKEQVFPLERRIKEAIFYSGDSLYDFEYLDYLPDKYKYDLDWLQKHKSFNPQEVILIVKRIKEILTDKNRAIPGLNEEMRMMLEHPNGDAQGKILNDFVEYMPFLTAAVFDKEDRIRQLAIAKFCKSVLSLFTICKSDLSGLNGADDYLHNFSFDLSAEFSEPFCGPGFFNVLQTKPLLKLSEDRYMVPLVYWLFVSVYEVPFYWLMADSSYSNKAGNHRGQASEEIAYNILRPVFGENLFRDIVIKGSKNKDLTDIDLLAVIGSVAICFQIKSKKLSEASKRGNMDSIRSDFDKAVQAAHIQGLQSKRYLLNSAGVKFFLRADNERFTLPEGISDIYIVCLTSENYPALSSQVFELAGKEGCEQAPIAFSVFDLRLMAYYLNTPFEFAYYIRQRIKTSDYYFATTEISLLGYHLRYKLWKDSERSRVFIDDSFASDIDQNYYPRFANLEVEPGTEDHIASRWRNKDFEELWKAIASHSDPRRTSVIFDLFDLSGDTVDEFMQKIHLGEERVKKTGKRVAISLVLNIQSSLGISFIIQPALFSTPLAIDMEATGSVTKYENHIDKWITLGRRIDSPYKVDLLMVDETPWVESASMEKAVKEYHKSTTQFASFSSNSKIGRNDPCPCGSGKKYKKCHGK